MYPFYRCIHPFIQHLRIECPPCAKHRGYNGKWDEVLLLWSFHWHEGGQLRNKCVYCTLAGDECCKQGREIRDWAGFVLSYVVVTEAVSSIEVDTSLAWRPWGWSWENERSVRSNRASEAVWRKLLGRQLNTNVKSLFFCSFSFFVQKVEEENTQLENAPLKSPTLQFGPLG